MKPDLPILPFASQSKFEDWLAKNHETSAGVWMKLAKKDSGIKSVTYMEALDIALCYGWIDGQKNSFDEKYFLQKFTPRRPKSIWSKINVEKVARLIKEGQMKPAGLKAIEAAKADGRWANAYDGQKNMSVPEDFQKVLDKNKKAKAVFESLKSSERYSFLFRIHNAKKAETRERRIKQFVEMLEKNEKFGNVTSAKK
ncbi:MAG: YdeI/OmpD-associated family protein [Anaerolineales bacterium]|nr:YdeI/OmpD-associated family protein [Anaerolineales bacterium]